MAAGPRTPDSESDIEIDTRYAAERWRYVCPRGHIDWRATPEGFVCEDCEDSGEDGNGNAKEAIGRFAALLDRRSRERIPRERVSVVRTAVAAAYETGSSETEPSVDRASPRSASGQDS